MHQIDDLKKKNNELLSFMDNIKQLNSTEEKENIVDSKEYEKLKVLYDSKIGETKSLKEDNEGN